MTARMLPMTVLSLLIFLMAACGSSEEKSPRKETRQPGSESEVDGIIEDGLRVLTIDPAANTQHHRIYRGDYIQVRLVSRESFTIEIPDLNVDKQFPVPEGDKPYIKVPESGTFPFTIGEVAGVIEALEFRAAAYREVTSQEAAALIANLKPFVLDVRTTGEFRRGHIEGATLIPIQELHKRLKELKGKEMDPVFIYCRSGNRSTVAGKFLVDAGFEQVINLRRGIVDWTRAGLPVVK